MRFGTSFARLPTGTVHLSSYGREKVSHMRSATIDGNEAAASIAHRVSEVIAIYPITPASPMGEHSDAWSSEGRRNILGTVPEVIEMQSEAGAAGVIHGALQTGALCTTFTASQGLLLMIPDMFKIAGQLLPTVFHIAARSVATHALSIFGDHSDVMAARGTGWALLASSNVQEAHDLALIAHAATLDSRVPFLHFFDGFRTSHEVNKIKLLSNDDIHAMINGQDILAHRSRALSPDRPELRGSSQNPDVFFQSREAGNLYYGELPRRLRKVMSQFAEVTNREYHLFDYVGAPDAKHIIVMMGSGTGAAEEAVQRLISEGDKVGLLKVRLYRPFDGSAFVSSLPNSVVRLAVLDRTKEPGSVGEPLYQDVVTSLAEYGSGKGLTNGSLPQVIGGRYGISSKEFTPAMAAAVFGELKQEEPKSHFTVGIYDDVTHLSLPWDNQFTTEPDEVSRAVFYGLGSDGTVGASKNSVKIVGECTPLFSQGYFVYDSKKAGSVTVSHLRFSCRPINSSYLIDRATFVSCNQFQFLERIDVLTVAEKKAIFLLNSPYGAEEVWDYIPKEAQQQIIDKQLSFFVVDANAIARRTGMGRRINTVMQTCFFALSKILPREEGISHIKQAIGKTYGRWGESVLQQNYAAVDAALDGLKEVCVPTDADGKRKWVPLIEANGSPFINRVTAQLVAGRGDLLPVSAVPADGSFPTSTSRYEKRGIANEIPIWSQKICTDCGLCAWVCPHAAIRLKAYPTAEIEGAPSGFRSKLWKGKDLPNHQLTVQVAPDDCTGCGVCVDVCPAKSKEVVRHRAINMEPIGPHVERERANFDFFQKLPELKPTETRVDTVKGSQLLQPLFEFSGACAGCGETPYLKLMSQLYGDRAIIANATGCSSIYGGNLPTTPWAKNDEGRGPTWCNSLFEDNAEFGLGMRLSVNKQWDYAVELLKKLSSELGESLIEALLQAETFDDAAVAKQRKLLATLKTRLVSVSRQEAKDLIMVADALVPRSVWIIGGDGWAYDIGFGGLDHVLTSGENVNILVLDTGVYSNTGGQTSKATPRSATAKFAASGKPSRKKDLGMLAVSYGNVYVGQIALGANPAQTLRVFREAESFSGPALILAYSQCVAHGIDMSKGMSHQKEVVRSGLWPLYRYDPRLAGNGGRPFHLDSRKPTLTFEEFAATEGRFAITERSNPEGAKRLFELAQQDIDDQWHYYEQMAGIERQISGEEELVECAPT